MNPQAATMRAKADQKVQVYQSMQASLDEAEKMMAFTGAPAAPRAAAPAAAMGGAMPMGGAAPVGGAVPSKEEVAAAKADADLFAWAHQTLAAPGSAKAG